MNILFIAPVYPSENYPTSIVFVQKQVEALVQKGHKVVVMDIDLRSIRWKRRWGRIHEIYKNIDVYRYAIPLGSRKVPCKIVVKIAEYIGVLLYKQICRDKKIKFDLIHAHFAFEAGNAAAELKKKYRIPFIVTEHSSSLIMKKSRIYRYIKPVYSSADKIISVSKIMAENIKQKFGNDSVIIANVIDESQFFFQQGRMKNEFTFLSVGRLIEDKRFDLTIKAFAELYKDNKEIKLLIVGNGEEQENLINLVSDLNIEEQVNFLGAVPNTEIVNIYHNADCFVLPSLRETFGVVYMEALACGLPVISTKCGGPEEFIHKEDGILIDIDDKAGLKKAMAYIMKNRQVYSSQYISERTIQKYGSDVFADKINDIYEAIVNKNRGVKK